MSTETIKIREATRYDCQIIAGLIKDLAIYEKMDDEAKLTAKDLERDAFDCNPPSVYLLVAEEMNSEIIGYVLYYFNYSMWKGKSLYMEDIFVKPEFRFKGVGEKFLKFLAKIADKNNYSRINFECIDWNEPAIKFYTKHGATDTTITEKWHSYRFENAAMKQLALVE